MGKEKKIRKKPGEICVYLADLTHEGIILSSNVFPLSIGLIGAYLKENSEFDINLELFKYPSDFSTGLERRKPDLVGFANYSWNFHLSYGYAKKIKAKWPDVPIVFGGPNYGLEDEEVEDFWNRYDKIDFNIVKEGEQAFVDLVKILFQEKLPLKEIKKKKVQIPNCHYVYRKKIIKGPDLPRLSLNDIPSPYLMGLMDKFFDDNLAPMIHTTRGCPFSCTFCTEGTKYYNKVEQRLDYLRDEMVYISKRMRNVSDLFISDANFGMYKQDIEKAKIIVEMQKQYGYPKYIHVSTGKNQKERVIDIAKSLNGAISMAASLQSTDANVLKNVARSNISIDKLTAVGKLANKVETGTYSEIILGLPGDSFESHKNSIKDCVEANFNNIRMYQLILLPQTVLNTPANRRKYRMKTKHRIMPRSYGEYKLFNKKFVTVESEEILIQHNTLSFSDYIKCRELDLTIEIIHNGRVYEELQKLCSFFRISWFDFIYRFYKKRRTYNKELTKMFDEFKLSHKKRLWESREILEKDVTSNFKKISQNEKGTNELSIAKATGFFKLFPKLNEILFSELIEELREQNRLTKKYEAYIREVEQLSLLRKKDLLDTKVQFNQNFSFDHKNIIEDSNQEIDKLLKNRKISFDIKHSPDQTVQIRKYLEEFGMNHDGLGKMLMRYPHINRIFRNIEYTK